MACWVYDFLDIVPNNMFRLKYQESHSQSGVAFFVRCKLDF